MFDSDVSMTPAASRVNLHYNHGRLAHTSVVPYDEFATIKLNPDSANSVVMYFDNLGQIREWAEEVLRLTAAIQATLDNAASVPGGVSDAE